MAILHVAQLGHPVLRKIAEPVDPDEIPSAEFQRFCDDLLETMYEYDGAGLAAPQVHHSIRVVCLILSDEIGPQFFINPVIKPLTEKIQRVYEGCLSVTGMRAGVDRPKRVRVEALDREGETVVYELQGFAASVVQHECDHLDGVLYVDRCDTSTLAFLPEYRRFGPLDLYEEELADDLSEELELLGDVEEIDLDDDDDPEKTLDLPRRDTPQPLDVDDDDEIDLGEALELDEEPTLVRDNPLMRSDTEESDGEPEVTEVMGTPPPLPNQVTLKATPEDEEGELELFETDEVSSKKVGAGTAFDGPSKRRRAPPRPQVDVDVDIDEDDEVIRRVREH